jgi:hypothetical protein
MRLPVAGRGTGERSEKRWREGSRVCCCYSDLWRRRSSACRWSVTLELCEVPASSSSQCSPGRVGDIIRGYRHVHAFLCEKAIEFALRSHRVDHLSGSLPLYNLFSILAGLTCAFFASLPGLTFHPAVGCIHIFLEFEAGRRLSHPNCHACHTMRCKTGGGMRKSTIW